MPELDTTNKRISNYVVRRGKVMLKDVAVKRVFVKNATEVSLDCLGLPVIVDGSGAFKFFVAGDDIAAAVGTGGIANAKVGIIVGSNEGYGRNQEATTFNTAGAQVHVMFGIMGDAIVKDNIDFEGVDGATASTGEQDAFKAQLELQHIAVQAVAESADPTYIL